MKNLVQRIVAVCLFFFINSYAWSVPAKPGFFTYKQPDGTKLTVRLVGDEFHHYYLSEDGCLLLLDSDSRLCYASLESNGIVTVSELQAHDISSRSSQEIALLEQQNRTDVIRNFLNRSEKESVLRRSVVEKYRKSNPYPTKGKQKVLVILAEFSDVGFATPNAKVAFNRMLNEKGYSDNGATGSARDYYMDSSNGCYEPEIDVFGPVKLSHPMAYYGANAPSGQDVKPWNMIADACKALDGEVRFSDYDLDKDGFVDNVYLFYAGYGEADGGPKESVWPHSFNLYPLVNIKLDGVQIDRYACSNEIVFDTDKMVGIGTFCHEFGHVLGLPDVYATDYAHDVHPGNWDIMSGGNYLNNGNTPPLMSAYERYFLDWMEPIELTQADTTVALSPLAENKAYRISTGNPNEYFLLENRQQVGWDKFIPGHGMLVWHIDYVEDLWNNNTPNDKASHQHIDIEEADGIPGGKSQSGDPFPGTSQITNITNTTRPNLKSWSNVDCKFVLFNIHETSDSLVLFDAIDPAGKFEKPLAGEATDITPVSFIAHWNAVDGATSYAIDVYTEISTVNGTKEVFAEGYFARPVGNVLSCEVVGLQPETKYFYRVRARNEKYIGDYSEPATLITGDKDYRFFYPEVTEATDITEHSFVANWSELSGTEKYFVSVISIEKGEEEVEAWDFANGWKEPAGWTTNVFITTDEEGYYGKASPAMSISKNRGLITSPIKENPVGYITFWYRAFNDLTESSRIKIYGYDETKSWKLLKEIYPLTKEEGGAVYSFNFDELDEEYYAAAIELSRPGSGRLALDDIEVCHQTTIVTDLPEYNDVDVTGNLSFVVSGLKSNTVYGYKVKGYNGNLFSKYSPVSYLKTKEEETSIESAKELYQDDFYVVVSEDGLTIRGLSVADMVYVYDVSGRLLLQNKVSGEECQLSLPKDGIYFIRVGNRIKKIVQ